VTSRRLPPSPPAAAAAGEAAVGRGGQRKPASSLTLSPSSTQTGMPLSAGIDENGLGPLLGPLVVTGALSSMTHEGCEPLRGAARGAPRLVDSKRIFSQRTLRGGEALALALIEIFNGARPSSMGELLTLLRCESAGPFPPPCRLGLVAPFCLSSDLELPIWCTREEAAEAASALGPRLEEAGLCEGCIVSAVWCPNLLNGRLSEGVNKFSVDLRAFLDVARVLGSRGAGGGIDVVAGKVGSRADYGAELERFFGEPPRLLRRGRQESAYEVGDFRLRFVLDADDAFVHVSIASIVGKYVREVFMEAVSRFSAALCGPGRRPSGYRDVVTKAFVRRVRPALLASGVDPSCFERLR
jgi:hypothetical protein